MLYHYDFIRTPNPSWSFPPPPPPSLSHFFLHRLQTSITQSFIKLECFLIPFLRTRSHDESAHTFGSSHWFLEVPKKRCFKQVIFSVFLNKMLVPHSATRLAAPVTLAPHRVEYGVSHHPDTILLYCTVLHCTVLCIATLPHCVQPLCPDIVSVNSMSVACCWVASPRGWDPATSPPQELEVGTHRAPYLLVVEYHSFSVWRSLEPLWCSDFRLKV